MTSAEQNEHIKKLGELIKDIRIAMLTTVESDGTLRSRPMGTQKQEFDGDLWFLMSDDSAKADEIQDERNVNLSYANPDDQRYVSVSGKATISHDHAKIEEVWSPIYKAWFPEGLDDPHLSLLKVHVEQAEYWDAPSSTVVHIVGFVKGVVTGQPYHPGENEKITL